MKTYVVNCGGHLVLIGLLWALLGHRGGVLNLWNKDAFKLIFSFFGEGFCRVHGEWGKNKVKCFIVSIYSPYSLFGKRKLWEDLLMSKRGFGKGMWCLAGDFNAILKRGERKGIDVQDHSVEIEEFRHFVKNMGLVDLPLLGRKFTWIKENGFAMSRLDRFLVSEEWLQEWPNPSQWALDRDVSDHCPIILQHKIINWGPKPFRFNNCWLLKDGFADSVKQTWLSLQVEGWRAYALKEKLKLMKNHLREWNMDVFGVLDFIIASLVPDISSLDKKAEVSTLSPEEISLRKEKIEAMWFKMKMKESLNYQKSRVKWIKEGDANTHFFHACINARRRSN